MNDNLRPESHATAPAHAGSGAVRVFTMNIWNFSGNYPARQRLLRAGIVSLQPDILAFQEAGYDGTRDQVRELLDGTDYQVIHQFDGLAALTRHDGCAIASRWPCALLEIAPLQVTRHTPAGVYAAILARVHAPEPIGPLLFACAKPSWELNREYERELQAIALTEAITRHAHPEAAPPIIAGDFDATPDSASIRFLTGKQSLHSRSVHFRDAWAEAGDGTPGYTWTYRNEDARRGIAQCFQDRRHERRIDYIFLGSPHEYRKRAFIRDARVVLEAPEQGVWPSDHYAVYAEIDISSCVLR